MAPTIYSATHGRQSAPSAHLDAMRGLAAIIVLAFHARLLFFVDRADVTPDMYSVFATVFYLATAFGREAVLAFFVLSGFLIAGSIHRDHMAGRWSAGRYAIARLSRLYVVLLPALALGLAWDILGLRLFPAAAVYHGTLANSAFPFDVTARLGVGNIFGTLGFVQSIVVAPPGSSEQFWSLAYEFWCYALFPLIYIALAGASWLWQRLAASAAVVAIAWCLGADVFAYFGCWLAGAAVALLPVSLQTRLRRYVIALVVAGLAVVALALYSIKAYGLRMPESGFVLAISFALLIASIASSESSQRLRAIGQCYGAVSHWLAQRSFSLYAIHLPVLVFLRAWCGDTLWQPTLANIGLWLATVVACVVYADLVWRLAERHTPAVRRWLLLRIYERANS